MNPRDADPLYVGLVPSAPSMSEDDLFAGITDALTLAGWRWTHIRDSHGVTVGSAGLPDIIAVHPDRLIVLVWELKDRRRAVTPEQAAWITAANGRRVDARVLRPADYDDALRTILGVDRLVSHDG